MRTILISTVPGSLLASGAQNAISLLSSSSCLISLKVCHSKSLQGSKALLIFIPICTTSASNRPWECVYCHGNACHDFSDVLAVRHTGCLLLLPTAQGSFLAGAGIADDAISAVPELPQDALRCIALAALHTEDSSLEAWTRLSLVARSWRDWLAGDLPALLDI